MDVVGCYFYTLMYNNTSKIIIKDDMNKKIILLSALAVSITSAGYMVQFRLDRFLKNDQI